MSRLTVVSVDGPRYATRGALPSGGRHAREAKYESYYQELLYRDESGAMGALRCTKMYHITADSYQNTCTCIPSLY